MRLILTGVTGFVGNEVLDQAINDSGIERVVAITRRPSGVSHAKLTEVVLRNFLDYSQIGEHLQADACIWCLGVSQTEVDKEEYIRITHDYTLAAARAMFAANSHLQFCFVSGSGADQEEKSRTLFGKIKGRTEKDLQKLSEDVVSFRPAFIRPSARNPARRWIIKAYTPIANVVDRFTDNFSVECEQLARCLIDVARNGSTQQVLDNAAIRRWQTAETILRRSGREL
jgi:uncharacterized protein YbjT (DUF2867 family)